VYSPSIQKLIIELKKLPSIGQRSAERFVFHWLKKGKKDVAELKLALDELLDNVKSCEVCWNFSETSPCPVCADKKRDHSTLCVVLEPQDIEAIEKTGEYKGVYHVLRENLDSTNESSIKKTKIPELLKRIEKEKTREVILALNPNLESETTTMFVKSKIESLKLKVKVSRLARGLPMGSDLQYADEITLGSALKNRV